MYGVYCKFQLKIKSDRCCLFSDLQKISVELQQKIEEKTDIVGGTTLCPFSLLPLHPRTYNIFVSLKWHTPDCNNCSKLTRKLLGYVYCRSKQKYPLKNWENMYIKLKMYITRESTFNTIDICILDQRKHNENSQKMLAILFS